MDASLVAVLTDSERLLAKETRISAAGKDGR
jgi:hypothetical protein